MKTPSKITIATSVAATITLATLSMPAWSTNALTNSQVWTTSNGSPIVTSNGNPVRTIHFKKPRRASKLHAVKVKMTPVEEVKVVQPEPKVTPVVVATPELVVPKPVTPKPVLPEPVKAVVEPVIPVVEPVLTPLVEPVAIEYTFNDYSATVLFDTASSTLTADATGSLTQLAMATANVNSILSVQVVGHADSRGDESYNMTLSEQRMNSVAKYLKSLKLKVTSMFAQGESNPVLDTNGENLELSRRVHVAIKTRRLMD